MKMTGEQRIAAPRQRVWEALNDPAVLRQCVPGCQSLEKDADGKLLATVGIRIGPINARLSGKLALSDLDPPTGYTLTGEGQGGAVGFAKGAARVRLAVDADATMLSYDVDAQVGGRLAQLGGAVIDATAKQLAGAFFKKFGEVVSAPDATSEPATTATGRTTASAASASATSTGAMTASRQSQTPAPPPAPVAASRPMPALWFVAIVVAGLAGFLIGHAAGGVSDRAALAIELLVLVVAAGGFEFGRRAAAPVVMLDPALLARLTADRR